MIKKNKLNFFKHCQDINGCNIYSFSIVKHLEEQQSPIYRFFSKEKYAKDFIKGKIRISTLYSCRELENLKARDKNEGIINPIISEKVIKDSNSGKDIDFLSDLRMTRAINIGSNCKNITLKNITTGSMSMQNVFVLCTSNNISDYLIKNYGKFCVQINHPLLLAYYLHLRMRNKMNSSYFRSEKVNYGNQIVDLAKSKINNRIGFEKENRFSSEDEFRSIFYPNKTNIYPYFEMVPEISNICEYIEF